MRKLISILTGLALIATASPVVAFAGGDCTDWEYYEYYYGDSSEEYYEESYEEDSAETKFIYDFGETSYFPSVGEGWDSVVENTHISKEALLMYNGWDSDADVLLNVPIKYPTNYTVDFSAYGCADIVDDCEVDYNDHYIWENEDEEVYYTTTYEEKIIGQQTLFNNPNADSWHNIVQATKFLDGVEIENGDVFSFYDQFPNQGGAEDGMIESNYFIDENTIGRAYGSGMCFDSTVTAQAGDDAKKYGVEVIERHAHVQDVGYAVRGVNDAAVNLSTDPTYRQDLKILNNTGAKIRFNYYVDSIVGALTCTITKLSEVITKTSAEE